MLAVDAVVDDLVRLLLLGLQLGLQFGLEFVVVADAAACYPVGGGDLRDLGVLHRPVRRQVRIHLWVDSFVALFATVTVTQ